MNRTGSGNPENPNNTLTLDATALAAAAAVVSAAIMLLLGIFGAIGVYEGAVDMMEQWHLFFSPSVAGTIGGMVEGAIIGYVAVWAVAWLYNLWVRG